MDIEAKQRLDILTGEI